MISHRGKKEKYHKAATLRNKEDAVTMTAMKGHEKNQTCVEKDPGEPEKGTQTQSRLKTQALTIKKYHFKQNFSFILAVSFLKLSQSLHFYVCSRTENYSSCT